MDQTITDQTTLAVLANLTTLTIKKINGEIYIDYCGCYHTSIHSHIHFSYWTASTQGFFDFYPYPITKNTNITT